MDLVFSLLIGAIIGFVGGMVVTIRSYNSDTALKLSNIINAAMLDCVTSKVIIKKQVHGIETIFFKHIGANFKHIKANHGDSYKENK